MKLKQQTAIDTIFIDSIDYKLLTGQHIINDVRVWVDYIQIYTR